MSTPVPENDTSNGPAESRREPAGRGDLPAWQKLERHAVQMRGVTLRELFDADPDRAGKIAVEDLGMYADFAKNPINAETLALLTEFAEQCGLREKIATMFGGQKINVSEHRAVLHAALSAPRDATIFVDGHNVVPKVHEVLDKMAGFATAVRSGQWRGHTGQHICNVINIGIGGSDLGPRTAYQALRPFTERGLRLEFVSNVDGAEFSEATRGLDPAETLFIVSSKSWHTLETLTNAATAREWLRAAFDGDTSAIARHYVPVSTNTGGVTEFGIDPANMFGFWDWVGGRYSIDSAVGLSLMVSIVPENFTRMLSGFHDVDEHFRAAPLERNIPAVMGLISVWYNNFLGAQAQSVLPYSHYLAHLPAYLQQLEMESNGKHVSLAGAQVDYQAGQIIWGQPGTNGEHVFYQLLHQGTKLVPCDFMAFVDPLSKLEHQHDLLTANVFAQTEGLAFGRSAQELRDAGSPEEQIPHRICKGNQPTTILLLDRLDPRSLGTLIALYEHKVFTEGVVWDVDAFDQWGVELGKLLAAPSPRSSPQTASRPWTTTAPPPNSSAATARAGGVATLKAQHHDFEDRHQRVGPHRPILSAGALGQGERFGACGGQRPDRPATLAHLLKYDSTASRLEGTAELDRRNIVLNGFPVLEEKDPAQLRWKELDVDIVIESTGRFTKRDAAVKHITAGAKKVIISAPAADADATFALDVNENTYEPTKHTITSRASCTTNCLALLAKVFHDAFGIEHGLLTTVRAHTADQNLQDGPHRDLSRTSAAAVNIIPTTTGAAKTIGLVLPELNGRLDGIAIRVSAATCSITDFTVTASRTATEEEIKAAYKAAADGLLKGLLEYTEDEIVSSDNLGNTASSFFDAGVIRIVGDQVRVRSWYDNEWGFSNRMVAPEQRNRLLSPRLMVYYMMALALFSNDSYEEVRHHAAGRDGTAHGPVPAVDDVFRKSRFTSHAPG